MAGGISHKTFNKGVARTIRGSLKRFVAIAVICMLGATMIVGLRAACLDLRYSADEFFDAQNLFDIRVQSTLGLTQEDVDALAALDGVEVAEGGWTETAYTSINGGSSKVEVRALSASGLNQPSVLEGELPQSSDEIAVTRRFAQESGLSIGDTVTFKSEADSGDAVADEDSLISDETSTTVFERKEYRISAVVLDCQDINAGEGTMSFRSSGSADYAFFVTEDNVTTDVFTVVYLSVSGADAPLCYSDEYEDMVDAVKQRVEEAREQREAARGASVRDEANDKIDDAEADANQQIADGQAQIDAGVEQIEDGRTQLAEGKAELAEQEASANQRMAEAQQKITDGLAQVEAGEAQLDAAEPQVREGISQIESGIEQARAARDTQIAAARQQVEDAVAQQFADNRATIEAAIAALDPAAEDYQAQKATLEAQLAQLSDDAESTAKQQAWAAQEESITAQVDDGINQTVVQLEAQRQELLANLEQIEASRATIAQTRQTLADAQEELDESRASASEQISEGWATIADSEAELTDGQTELDEAQAELDASKQEAAEKIADARAEVADIEDPTWYIQTRDSLSSYASVESDASCIEVLGTVLPMIFFLVAVLISLTTMTRMVEEERGLIGLYKALGYGRGRILSKYVIYAGVACLVGCALGDFVGFVVLPAIIFTIFGTMYALPAFTYHLDTVYAVAAIVLFAVGIIGATVLTCRKELREVPASLMRPKAPKAGSRILLERVRFIWSRMSFLNKVTARNLLRYKRRFLMTVLGIAGCVALLICGFGIRDTVLSLSDRQYGSSGVQRYDLMCVTSADDLGAVAGELANDAQVDGLLHARIDSLTASVGKTSESVTLVVVPDGTDLSGYVGLSDGAGNALEVPSSGCLITKNAEQVLGFAAGDSIHVQDSTLAEADVQVEGIAINYLGNFIFMSESAYKEAFGSAAEQNGLLANLSGSDAEKIEFADQLSDDARLLSVSSTQKLVRDFSSAFTLINTVVYVVIVLAAALAFTVVFTLSNTNISERERELATIKVLGFLRPEVHVYINKETIILTVIGILCGMPLGYALTHSLTYVLKMPSLYFDTIVAWPTYLIAAALALLFTLMVNFITNRSLDRVDMVGALKSAE